MPITYQVDHDHHLIAAVASGAIGERDLSAYQTDIKSQPALAGYDEILDVTRVDGLLDINIHNLRKLAAFAASSDVPDKLSKFVIVAPQDVYFGLSRMYESFREGLPRSRRKLAVFHSRAEAEGWLSDPAE